MKNKEKNNKIFNYVVIAAVLIIPFMYSYFYLKAYWDPYGEGNIDNLPVAIVNEDKGDKGDSLINSIKDSKKLKIEVVDEKEASDGLYDKTYYAVINIPSDFTSSMESAKEVSKKHATITYSPNQKSNYLASQIINSVVLNVEKSLDNTVNSAIVDNLSENLNSVPDQLTTISDGFSKLGEGTQEIKNGTSSLASGADELKSGTSTLVSGTTALENGSNSLKNGLSELNDNYTSFNNGLKSLKDGANTLNTATSQLSTLSSSLNELTTGVSTLKAGSDQLLAVNNYVDGTNKVLDTVDYATTLCTDLETSKEQQLCAVLKGISTSSDVQTLRQSGDTIKNGNTALNNGLTELNNKVSSLGSVANNINTLQTSINTLATGANSLYDNSVKIHSGINTLYNGAVSLDNGISQVNSGAKTLNSGVDTLVSGTHELDDGVSTLNNSVTSAKSELDTKIDETKTELEKVNGLTEYSEEPVKVDTVNVNEVSSYGASFSPLFISIALWVGALMMYVVLYYDKEVRFPKLSIDNTNHLQRTLCYHGLATLSAIVLGILLNLLLDFDITNYLLYYFLLILTANTFIAIIEFLIINFKDIGKFLALIILVLQLAASGGTFPIETVSKCFRFLNPILPMTYTINLFKEALIAMESDLLVKNLIIVLVILIVFAGFNIVSDILHDKKNS